MASPVTAVPADNSAAVCETAKEVPPVTKEDFAKIERIITVIHDNGLLQLPFYYHELNSLGNEIDPLHPFQFLGAIFGSPKLGPLMPALFEDFFKRNGFLQGVEKGMTRDFHRLEPVLASFAKKVHTTPEALRPYIQKRDWDGMVRHLIAMLPRSAHAPPA